MCALGESASTCSKPCSAAHLAAVLVVVEHDDEFARQVALGDCCRTDGQQRDREKRLEGVGQFHEGIKSLVAAKLVGVL